MRYWIFSYGSLANKDVAERTGRTLSFLPAMLNDYLRNFRVRVGSSRFAAAGIERAKGKSTLGMLVEVPEEELPKFDRRESFYDRVELERGRLKPLEGELPEGIFYLYVPKNPQPPTELAPISQSYIDVMVSAYLNLGENLARQFLRTSSDLDKPWLDDRLMPRYVRYLEGLDTEAIDRLIREEVPDYFRARAAQSPEIYVKPELETAILKTIAFFDLFDFPLSPDELMENLYQYDKPLHIKELKATLNFMAEQGKLTHIKGYFVLPGKESLIETRKTRKFIAEKFWNRTKLYGTYMRSIPFVEMIAVCNNLAYDNPSEQSDIDLYIVVKPGRMWLARFLITVTLHFYGVRRYGDKIAGRFCLSFFVTDENLAMEPFELKPEDPYLAYWTKNLKPIYGENTYDKFREKNAEWLRKYGLSFDESYKKHMYHPEKGRLKLFWEWVLGGLLGDFFEAILKKTLKKRTLAKQGSLGPEADVIISDDILKFHNHDRRQEFFDRWKAKDLDSA